MKKIALFFAFMMAIVSTQAETPVKGYKLVAEKTRTECPSDWTDFKLKPDCDTLNGDWLTTIADPTPLRLPAPSLPNMDGIEIGFDFPFAGQTMTVFGVTGDGIVYLGTEEKFVPAYYVTAADHNLVSHCIQASPFTLDPSYKSPVIESDRQTKIGYHTDTEKGELSIRFENIRLSKSMDTCRWSYDLILSKDGSIALDCIKMDTLKATDRGQTATYLMYTLKGEHAAGYIMAKNWQGETASNKSYLPIDKKNFTPATRLIFTYPEACVKPEGVTATITFRKLLSTSFMGTLSLQGTRDGFIAFLADREQVSEKPIDGKTYKIKQGLTPADSIADFPILVSGATTSLTVNDLQSEKNYFLYIYPYLNLCDGGPFYSENAVVLPVELPKPAPGIDSISADENTLTLFFHNLNAEEDVLVGISQKDYAATDNMITLPENPFSTGDTIFYQTSTAQTGAFVITTAYMGKANQSKLTIEGLDAGTPYYLYVWGKDRAVWTKQYSSISTHTIGNLPQTFSFATDRISNAASPIVPAGWNIQWSGCPIHIGYNSNIKVPSKAKSMSPEFSADEESRLLKTALRSIDGKPFYNIQAVTPSFVSNYAAIDVFSQIQMTARISPTENGCVQFDLMDTLILQCKTVSQDNWQDILTITNSTTLVYEPDGFALIKARIQVPEEEKIQLRYLLKGDFLIPDANKVFALKSVYIEQGLPCRYPQDIKLNDSLTTHRVLVFDYKDENEQTKQVQYRYKKEGQNEWSAFFLAQSTKQAILKGLSSDTRYQTAWRSLCGNDTSLVKIVEAQTKMTLPYTQNFTDLSALPQDYETFSGSLPQTGNAPLTKVNGGFQLLNYKNTGRSLGIGLAQNDRWIILPELCIEELPADIELNFKTRAFNQNVTSQDPLPENCPVFLLILASQDRNFSTAEIIDTIFVKNLSPEYSNFSTLISGLTGHLHVALYLPEHEMEDFAAYTRYNFALDSLSLTYDGDIPCTPVTDIRQRDLTTKGITLSWIGYSFEYGIELHNTATNHTDTIYTYQSEYTFTSLDPGTLYLYRILPYCSENHQSPGSPSEEGFFTTNDICATPQNFAVIETTWQSVMFTGHAAANILLHIWAEDTVKYKDINYYFPDWTPQYDTMMIAGLFEAINIPYLVAARSVCSPGDSSVWTDTLRFVTDFPECGTPTNLKSDVTSNSAVLTWTPGKNNRYYSLVWKPTSTSIFDSVYSQKPTWTLANLNPNTAYVWQVKGVCDEYLISNSAESNFSTGTVGLQQNPASQIQIGVSNRRISILNPNALPIDRVEVFNLLGQLYYKTLFGLSENILLPEISNLSGAAIVRIVSNGMVFTRKVVLL